MHGSFHNTCDLFVKNKAYENLKIITYVEEAHSKGHKCGIFLFV